MSDTATTRNIALRQRAFEQKMQSLRGTDGFAAHEAQLQQLISKIDAAELAGSRVDYAESATLRSTGSFQFISLPPDQQLKFKAMAALELSLSPANGQWLKPSEVLLVFDRHVDQLQGILKNDSTQEVKSQQLNLEAEKLNDMVQTGKLESARVAAKNLAGAAHSGQATYESIVQMGEGEAHAGALKARTWLKQTAPTQPTGSQVAPVVSEPKISGNARERTGHVTGNPLVKTGLPAVAGAVGAVTIAVHQAERGKELPAAFGIVNETVLPGSTTIGDNYCRATAVVWGFIAGSGAAVGGSAVAGTVASPLGPQVAIPAAVVGGGYAFHEAQALVAQKVEQRCNDLLPESVKKIADAATDKVTKFLFGETAVVQTVHKDPAAKTKGAQIQ